ncbi:MAG: Multi-sensor signal transduction histidine kinase [Microgenomates group bacterium GW2011_GWC1_37_12b]|uniref:histidine kinase n=1 Tax=Candidatus Woesebacteria bacterium GW2011_GWB1_38_8b TaxID=1618571 RepID=A0A0G0L580_9BACT|nr:MAG: Multi-sensor signal transduction histidine kinase [Microgenomates group bacterium GW2011_GWC1_37_12b]KKQ87128.1 MAG: Multi-sensor signal transduction histidine kinase [Candidatus Woesebacteria bacterium GW2011_GWB1_38_8b]
MVSGEPENNIENSVFKLLHLDDGPFDSDFDAIATIVKDITKTSYSGISFYHDNKVFFRPFKGGVLDGIPMGEYFRSDQKNSEIININNTIADPNNKFKPVNFGEIEIRSIASAPFFRYDKQMLGEIFVADKIERDFSENDVKYLKYFADLISKIIVLKVDCRLEKNVMQDKYNQISRQYQTLEEEGVRSQAMLKDIGDALVATDNSGNINFVNDAALTAMGYESMEVMGKSFIKMFRIFNKDGKEVESNENPLRNALFFNKKVKSNECLLLKKSGDQFQVSITATPVIFYQRTIGGIVVIRDITREKDVDRMKTEFISLASHQLRTPLSSIKWLVELLLDDYKGMNEEQIQIVKNVYESNQRMIDLVDGLLNISRIESGRIIIEPKATNLKTLVEKIVGELTPKIIEKELKVNIDIANDVPEISVDPKLISNVYLNFLTNSIKYSINKGQVNVKIYIKDSDVISEVKDSGLGIPKKQQARVFEKFFRADNVTRVVTDGSGLGLYLTKLIVEASGGKIGFESEELKGSTFWFSVPIAGVLPKKGEVSIE